MDIKSINPKLKQKITKKLGLSSSTLQRYRKYINMLSLCRIPPNTHKRRQKTSNEDLNRPQRISNVLKRHQLMSKVSSPFIETVKPNTSEKCKLKCGVIIEMNDVYLDENLRNKNLWMEIAMQIIFIDKTVWNNLVQDIKEVCSQSVATQAKKGEQLVSMMPASSKAFDLMGDDIVDLSRENESLKKKIGS